MRFADGTPQAVHGLRHRNQMDVIWHQAIAPNLDPFFAAPLGHQLQIRRVVAVVEKRLLSAIAALGNVMGQTGNN